MRWAIMGAGATGGYFGALLARAGEHVTFIARGPHLAALRRHGLRVRSTRGDFDLVVTATDAAADCGPVDVVLFAVKSYDTGPAADAIAPLIGTEAAVLCVQNGVDNEDLLAARFGAERVLGGATRIEATVPEPGVVAHLSPFARLAFGAWNGPAGPRERAILDIMLAAGIDAALGDDARLIVWEKFLFLCPGAAITSITRMPFGEVLSCPESRELLRAAVAEVAAVARAEGVAIAAEAVDTVMAGIGGYPPTMRTSMQRDLASGKRIELEALSGAVVRHSREVGVPTPVHGFVYAALKPAAIAAQRAATPAPA